MEAFSEELPEVIIVNDTSGSTMGFQSHFANEASGVLSAYKTTVRVIYCDAMVHMEEEYATEDLPIVLKPVGGGGTSFVPAFEYITKMGYTPNCLLFLTDLYGTFPYEALPCQFRSEQIAVYFFPFYQIQFYLKQKDRYLLNRVLFLT